MSVSLRIGRREAFEAKENSGTTATRSGSSPHAHGTGSVSSTAAFSEGSGSYSYSYSYSETRSGSDTSTTASTDTVAGGANLKRRQPAVVVGGSVLPVEASHQLPPRPPIAAKALVEVVDGSSDSYSYSYSDSYSDEEDSDSYSYSTGTKSLPLSGEAPAGFSERSGSESGGRDTYSSPSSYSGSYGYSYSTDSTGSTGYYDSYGSYTGSSGSYSYSYSTNSKTGGAEKTSSLSTTEMDSMSVDTKRPDRESSGSYSYSYSVSSKDATGKAPDLYGSLTNNRTGEGSGTSLTRSTQSTGSSATSLSSSPRQKKGTDYVPEQSSSGATTTSLIEPSRTLSCSVSSSVTRSLSTPSMKELPREVLVLTTNAEKPPAIAELPPVCFIPQSADDVLSRLLDRIADVQAEVLRREAEEDALATIRKQQEEEKKKKKKKNASEKTKEAVKRPVEVPEGHFSRKSLKFALRAVGMCDAAERSAMLKSVFVSDSTVSRDTSHALLKNCSHHCLVQRVSARFHAHDRFRSAEVPLLVALDLLERCGFARVSAAGAALSIVAVASRPMLRVASHAETRDLPAGTAELPGTETPPPPRSTQIIEETIDVCRQSPAGVDAYWREREGDVYVGTLLVARGVRSRAAGKALTAQIAAMTHVCRAVDACIVGDASRPSVQYLPLLSALLGAPHSLLVENATAAVLNPMRAARALEAHVLRAGDAADPLLPAAAARAAADWALPADSQGPDSRDLDPPAPGADGVCCAVALVKLRVAAAAPAGARCYCLVSARRSAAGEWMAPVEAPAVRVRPSRRGGFVWEFAGGAAARVLFAGARGDQLYVEACCAPPGDAAHCVGHAAADAAALRSGPLPLRPGSLADPGPPTGEKGPIGSGPGAEARGLWCALWGCRAAQRPPTLEIAVSRVRARDLPRRAEIPARLLALRRHAPIVALIRDAVSRAATSARSAGAGAAQAVRQQHAQACLTVAASTTLMDAMLELWERTLKGKLGPKPKEPAQERAAIIALATKIAAAHNCIAHAESREIANLITGAARIPIAADPQIPLKPIEV